MGSSVSWTPQASHSVWEYRFRLLGDGFKIKSITPYCSQSERGTQPWGGGQFSTSPGWERGGVEERRECVGSPGLGRENIKIFLLFPEGEASSRVGLQMGGWFGPLLRGTRQARMQGGGGGGP